MRRALAINVERRRSAELCSSGIPVLVTGITRCASPTRETKLDLGPMLTTAYITGLL